MALTQRRATLFEPPQADPNRAPLENDLELTPVLDIGPDVFTNTRPLWHPPGARGIFGGGAIAQSLAAAQLTVPSNFTVHSMHCYFVLAGDSEIPILYHVERVRDGRSFATRTVQARQRGKPIFTTTLSFNREGSGGKKLVTHAARKPDLPSPPESYAEVRFRPFETVKLGVMNPSAPPEERKVRQWSRARGRIVGGHQSHLSALAYMTDHYFVGTIARVQGLDRFTSTQRVRELLKNLSPSDKEHGAVKAMLEDMEKEEELKRLEKIKASEDSPDTPPLQSPEDKREISMMLSLDHTIFFHNPRAFRADEWMLAEMESHWAGEGRGLVTQKIWSHDGVLIATCMQEGVVRLKQDELPDRKAKL